MVYRYISKESKVVLLWREFATELRERKLLGIGVCVCVCGGGGGGGRLEVYVYETGVWCDAKGFS